jgi:GAF domain-containing protein
LADTNLLDAVNRLTRTLAQTSDLEKCLRATLETSVRAVEGTAGTIFLHNAEEHVLRFFHCVRVLTAKSMQVDFALVGSEISENEGIAGEVFRTGIPQVTDDAHLDPDHAKRFDDEIGFTTETIITIPLRRKDETIYGVLQVLNRQRSPFSKADIRTLQALEAILWMRNAIGG